MKKRIAIKGTLIQDLVVIVAAIINWRRGWIISVDALYIGLLIYTLRFALGDEEYVIAELIHREKRQDK